MKKNDKIKYGDAAAELDEILEHIEEGEVDIDDLAGKVERAATLIEVCRQKLTATEVAVKKIVEELNATADEDGQKQGDESTKEPPF